MQQTAAQTQQTAAQQARKKSMVVAGLGAAFVAAGITAAIMASSPTPPVAAPAQIAEPAAKACQRAPLIELASAENGGGGIIRLRQGDFLSPPITLTGTPQQIVFPKPRPELAPMAETIIVEGNATNLVLGAEGDHFVVPSVNGTYSYTITWSPSKC
jgi:hypothetical protein